MLMISDAITVKIKLSKQSRQNLPLSDRDQYPSDSSAQIEGSDRTTTGKVRPE
jgi:hypothetical protein